MDWTETNSKSLKETTELGVPVLEGVTVVNGCEVFFTGPPQPDNTARDTTASSVMRLLKTAVPPKRLCANLLMVAGEAEPKPCARRAAVSEWSGGFSAVRCVRC